MDLLYDNTATLSQMVLLRFLLQHTTQHQVQRAELWYTRNYEYHVSSMQIHSQIEVFQTKSCKCVPSSLWLEQDGVEAVFWGGGDEEVWSNSKKIAGKAKRRANGRSPLPLFGRTQRISDKNKLQSSALPADVVPFAWQLLITDTQKAALDTDTTICSHLLSGAMTYFLT
eukprot:1148190-Pelagomonas_calceolata.AAC.2